MHLYQKISDTFELLKSENLCNRKIIHRDYELKRECVSGLEYLPWHILIMTF